MTMSMVSMVLAAAKPWTYWLAPPLLVAELIVIVGLAIGYHRKVVVPRYQRQLYEQQRQVEQLSERGMATVHQLIPSAGRPQRQRVA